MIYDSKGNVITNPDQTKGRILQENGKLVYYTWAEKPDVDANGNVIDHSSKPSVEDRISAAESAIDFILEKQAIA